MASTDRAPFITFGCDECAQPLRARAGDDAACPACGRLQTARPARLASCPLAGFGHGPDDSAFDDAADTAECSTMRERSGLDVIPSCPVHGEFLSDDQPGRDTMGPDDFHDLGLCPDCEADLTIASTLHADDCPLAARFAPWTDEDTAELAGAMARAADRRAAWTAARRGAAEYRAEAISAARLTRDELATAAARFGIVADPDALPLRPVYGRHAARIAEVIARQRETGDVWANARRHYRNRDIVAEITRRDAPEPVQWAADILRGDALPLPESHQRSDQDHAETHPGRFASWPIVQAAR